MIDDTIGVNQLKPRVAEDLVPNELMTSQFTEVYREMLSYSGMQLDTQLSYRNVRLNDGQLIHEIYTIGDPSLPHLVLLHGFGGGAVVYIRLLKDLSTKYQVHAIDTLGVGLSSRNTFNEDFTAEQSGRFLYNGLQKWREVIGIEQMILVGHSFGGYIASLYCQQHSTRVESLVLLSPAGSTTFTPQELEERYNHRTFKSRVFYFFAKKVFSIGVRPYRMMRICYFGDKFIDKVLEGRLRLQNRQKQLWKTYFKSVSAVETSSETAFYKLFQWPLIPPRSIESMIKQGLLAKKVFFLFGDQDWMSSTGPKRLTQTMENVKMGLVPNAGHQMMFDNPHGVSESILRFLR